MASTSSLSQYWQTRQLLLGLLVLLMFGSFAWLGRTVAMRFQPEPEKIGLVRREAVPRPGKQYVLVYVGSSRCGPSNAPGVAEHVREAMAFLRARAQRDSVGFVAIGVARESSAESGLLHLANIGGFDELSAGQGVLNQASAHFISVDHRGMAATPQIVVLERTLFAAPAGVDASNVVERVLLRKIGVNELAAWTDGKAPIPLRRLPIETSSIASR